MGRSVVITTPIPTTDQVAKRLGVGKRRLAMIKQIARQVRETPGEIASKRTANVDTAEREQAAS